MGKRYLLSFTIGVGLAWGVYKTLTGNPLWLYRNQIPNSVPEWMVKEARHGGLM